jgi:hypothetical protein
MSALFGNVAGRDAFKRTDPHPRGLESGLSAKATHVLGVGHIEAGHRVALPAARVLDRWDIPANSPVPGVAQHLGEVLAQLRAIRVQISHE